MTKRSDFGDGDICPLVPSHGQMFFLEGTKVQWCAHQSHDGRPEASSLGPVARTRSVWPQGHESFRLAVAQATLPEIDIRLLTGDPE